MEGLEDYQALVRRYHRTLDLMSDRAVEELPTKVEEALAYAALLEPRLSPTDRVLDLGSGVGIPGIVLAVALPNHQITLVERRQRRANFLKICAGQLGLANVAVVTNDVQAFDDNPYAFIAAQAVGRFSRLYCLTRHLHTPTIGIISRRGEISPAELAELEAVSGPVLEIVTAPLPTHGKLALLKLTGGRPCPSSG